MNRIVKVMCKIPYDKLHAYIKVQLTVDSILLSMFSCQLQYFSEKYKDTMQNMQHILWVKSKLYNHVHRHKQRNPMGIRIRFCPKFPWEMFSYFG